MHKERERERENILMRIFLSSSSSFWLWMTLCQRDFLFPRFMIRRKKTEDLCWCHRSKICQDCINYKGEKKQRERERNIFLRFMLNDAVHLNLFCLIICCWIMKNVPIGAETSNIRHSPCVFDNNRWWNVCAFLSSR